MGRIPLKLLRITSHCLVKLFFLLSLWNFKTMNVIYNLIISKIRVIRANSLDSHVNFYSWKAWRGRQRTIDVTVHITSVESANMHEDQWTNRERGQLFIARWCNKYIYLQLAGLACFRMADSTSLILTFYYYYIFVTLRPNIML